jgi:hypothetical protein
VLGALVPMPVLVWGVDEIFRALRRQSQSSAGPHYKDLRPGLYDRNHS